MRVILTKYTVDHISYFAIRLNERNEMMKNKTTKKLEKRELVYSIQISNKQQSHLGFGWLNKNNEREKESEWRSFSGIQSRECVRHNNNEEITTKHFRNECVSAANEYMNLTRRKTTLAGFNY